MAVESISPLPTDESPAENLPMADSAPIAAAQSSESEAEHEVLPKGALAFGLVVLTGFALYWLVTYLEVVIGRQ